MGARLQDEKPLGVLAAPVDLFDGSARGGILVALADRFGLPVHAIGVGEGADDLRPFDAGDFARNLLGIGTMRLTDG